MYSYSIKGNPVVMARPNTNNCSGLGDRVARAFEHEIMILSQLNHTNIIKLLGIVEDEVGFFMEDTGGKKR